MGGLLSLRLQLPLQHAVREHLPRQPGGNVPVPDVQVRDLVLPVDRVRERLPQVGRLLQRLVLQRSWRLQVRLWPRFVLQRQDVSGRLRELRDVDHRLQDGQLRPALVVRTDRELLLRLAG